MTAVHTFLLVAGLVTGVPDVLRQTPSMSVGRDTEIQFKLVGTERLPTAKGRVLVADTRHGRTVTVKLHGMRPASLFGGDFNTYVLWIVGEAGRVRNVGEVELTGRHAELSFTTDLDRFGILISAEPHYLVDSPSRFVVVELADKRTEPISYRGTEGSYAYERDSLEATTPATGAVETAVPQAMTAVRLAQRSRPGACAAGALLDAEKSLEATLSLIARNSERQEIEASARQTVRLAVSAQTLGRSCAPRNR